jgi:hypothetical protein
MILYNTPKDHPKEHWWTAVLGGLLEVTIECVRKCRGNSSESLKPVVGKVIYQYPIHLLWVQSVIALFSITFWGSPHDHSCILA